ncbi:MAG: restriction endonuclease subunit S [Treponema sp.]|nr:restriction endonuclease subunit S [Treponema sp.]
MAVSKIEKNSCHSELVSESLNKEMLKQVQHDNFVELGELIEICDIRNTDKKYGIDDVCGMTIEKEIIPTKADVKDTDLSKFYIVQPQEFVYNPRTHGRKIGLGFNNSNKPILISWNNTAFKVKDPNRVIPTYLYMIFTRDEWDREACFNSWGSSTVVFAWEDFCKIKIPLPSIETQRELVAVYNGLKELAEENEKLLEPLSKSCEAFIVDCKKKYPSRRLGDYIEESDERNSNLEIKLSQGISNLKYFQEPKQVAENSKSDKIVRNGFFAYNRATTRNGEKISIAYREGPDCTVSSAYGVFKIVNEEQLNPHFLMMWFLRPDFDRYARWRSEGSAHEFFTFEMMQNIKIPLPPIQIQQKIVDLYNCYEECKRIAKEAREKISKLCPALVQKAAHSR